MVERDLLNKIIVKVMIGGSRKKAISTIPLKIPSPDTSNRSNITVTQSPDFKFRYHAPRTPTNTFILLDEISSLKAENQTLKQQLQRLMDKNMDNSTHKNQVSDERENLNGSRKSLRRDDQEERDGNDDKDGRAVEAPDISKEKDRLIACLKRNVNDLESKLSEVSLVDSGKYSSLQKENKRLKEVIELNLGSRPDPTLQLNNDRLQRRVDELTDDIIRLRQSKQTPIEPKRYSQILLNVYQNQYHRYMEQVQVTFDNFVDRLGDSEAELFALQNKIEQIKSARPRRQAGMDEDIHVPLAKVLVSDKGNQTEEQQHRNKEITKSISLSLSGSVQVIPNPNPIPPPPQFPSLSPSPWQSKPIQISLEIDQNELQHTSQQVEQMNKMIRYYEEEITQKNNKIEKMEEEAASIEHRLRQMEGQMRQMAQNPGHRESRELLDLRREIEHLKQIMEMSKRPQRDLLEQLRGKNSQLQQLEVQLLQFKQIVQQLESELRHLKSVPGGRGEDESSSVLELRQQMGFLQEQNEILTNNINMRIEQKNQQLDLTEKQIQSLKREMDDLKGKFETSEADKVALERRFQQNSQEVAVLRSNLKGLQQENLQLKEDGNKINEICLNLHGQLEVSENNRKSLAKSVEDHVRNKKELDALIGQKDHFIKEMAAQVDSVKSVLSSVDFTHLEATIQSASKNQIITQLSPQQLAILQHHKTNAIQLAQTNTQLQLSIQTLSSSLQHERSTRNHLSQEISQLKEVIKRYMADNPEEEMGSKVSTPLPVTESYFVEESRDVWRVRRNLGGVSDSVRKTERHVMDAMSR